MAKAKDATNLEDTLKNLNKMFGTGSVGRLGELATDEPVEVISTGSLTLDKAIGVGGIPKGRIIEIWGLEAAGKSLLCMNMVAECQKNGGIAAYVDAEHAFNPEFASQLGVDVDSLIFSQPDSGEDALTIVENLIPHTDIIIIDSVANLVPKAIIEGTFDQSHVGVQARMMSQALRKLTATANRHSCSLVFVNQIREKIGVMYGDPKTTTGGNALKFYASVRLEMRKMSVIKEGDTIVGHRAEVTVKKNKVAAPFKKAEFDIYYEDGGIDRAGEIIDIAVDAGLIDKSGSWFTLFGERYQGRTALRKFLKDNEEAYEQLKEQVLQVLQ